MCSIAHRESKTELLYPPEIRCVKCTCLTLVAKVSHPADKAVLGSHLYTEGNRSHIIPLSVTTNNT